MQSQSQVSYMVKHLCSWGGPFFILLGWQPGSRGNTIDFTTSGAAWPLVYEVPWIFSSQTLNFIITWSFNSPVQSPQRISLLFKYLFILYMWVLCFCLQAQQERTLDPITESCEPLCGCWELNSDPLEEQSVLLTTEPSISPALANYTWLDSKLD